MHRNPTIEAWEAAFEARLTAEWAAHDAATWGAELLAMAGTFDAAVPLGASAVTAAALRDAATVPPDCEEAFRYRLCMVLDLHPRQDAADLDAAVARALARVGSAA